MELRLRKLALVAGCIIALQAFGCATFKPTPIHEIPFTERAETLERDGLRVTVAVPTRDEARRIYGIDMSKKLLQPVWLEIENSSKIPYVVMLSGIDPMYFSANEASRRNNFSFRPFTNRKMNRHFGDLQIATLIPPQGSTSGFVITNLTLGTKEVHVKLFGPRRQLNFEFYVPVPGFKADYHKVDFEKLRAMEHTNYEDEEAFRAFLRELPCCTSNRANIGKGDPVNLVIIGDAKRVSRALMRSGWDETERLTFASGWRTFKAFFGGEYKYSPMSSLYLFGRPQDAGFQRARDTIHERNHLRLWFAPVRFHGQEVWVGTITRDIGVYFTLRTWNLTTHAIDPNVDEARTALREGFQMAEVIARFGYGKGVGAATREEPHRNMMGAKWWTDGLRLVVQLSDKDVPLEEENFFFWNVSGEGSEELKEQIRELMEE